MYHVTLDIETLGTAPGAAIVQVAAVLFNRHGTIINEVQYRIREESWSGYTMDPATVSWWMTQPDEAREAVFGGDDRDKDTLRSALTGLGYWFASMKTAYGELPIWSHASFDMPILQAAYRQEGMAFPLNHRMFRDIRTLTHLTGVQKTKVEGIAHTALDDCRNQAKYISKALEVL